MVIAGVMLASVMAVRSGPARRRMSVIGGLPRRTARKVPGRGKSYRCKNQNRKSDDRFHTRLHESIRT